jgi:hypothetical protein
LYYEKATALGLYPWQLDLVFGVTIIHIVFVITYEQQDINKGKSLWSRLHVAGGGRSATEIRVYFRGIQVLE